MDKKGQSLIGTQLGTCILKQLIGSGGMGMVFLARQSLPVRDVAVKVLRPPVSIHSEQYAEFLTRFRREANVVAQLDQINILPVYEYGEQDGSAYLVMPYLSGGSLKDLLARKGSLSPQEALSYLEQAAAGLQYAHEHKIVHRDIKPANMLFHSDGRLVLVDFGIARIVHDPGQPGEPTLTGPEHLLGSVEYMAPEMVRGGRIDARADIYELGIVLYQMLSGKVPFQGQTPLVVAAQQVDAFPPSLLSVNALITQPMNAVVQKALAKRPEDRYSSVKDFAQAFRTAVLLSLNPPSQNPPRNVPPSRELNGSLYTPFQTEVSVLSSSPANHEATSASPLHPQLESTQPGQIPSPLIPHVQREGRKQGSFWFIGCLILLLVIGIGVWTGWPTIRQIVQTQQTNANHGHEMATATPSPSPTADPSQQAIDVIQAFYDDVNHSDYKSAYQLWGADYQSKNPYATFAQGYAQTQHDDISFGNVTPQANGQYIVNVTIQATEQKDNGTVVTTYRGTYTVGMENGSLKMITGFIQVVK
ncbi:serine/threonine-protein kinase [Tengunoibacter tsumagoiensis]|uniref:non-specific serine/threonine protein kinase n=1 Tax=Tengunoibacter tsumagoiensis TaxID=2014871 RepID=A0A401ZWF3_9CHLR|nr:serine/threonine-protein kinase [Tengunoibacter tsumagoiensis]GCE11187.1 hypothetical protein KTT_10460 [Tengunoibacter tsumagoiensis]